MCEECEEKEERTQSTASNRCFFATFNLIPLFNFRGRTVKVVKKREGVRIPDGWHKASVEEARARRAEIVSEMGEWDIAELVGGKISGRGYGGKIETCGQESYGHLVLLKNSISFPEETGASGNVYTVEPPLVEIDQPPALPAPWAPPSRSWGPANDSSQPDFGSTAPREKGESEIVLKPPSYNEALTM